MKKLIAKTILASLLLAPISIFFPLSAGAVGMPNWDTTGSYIIDMNYCDPGCADYAHDMILIQDNAGNLTGNGGYPAGGPHTYTWVIDSGSNVSADTIYITAHYTAPAAAVTPLTTLIMNGTIDPEDGTMSGTWSDNYQGGARAGTWTTSSGMAMYTYVTTNLATAITDTDATLNGMNGGTAGTGHSFWASTSTFSTASPSIPAGVYSTPNMGPIAPHTAFSAMLSSLTTSGVPSNMPAVTPDTTYYFAAWSLVDGTWHPGEVLNFTTDEEEVDETPGTSNVTIVKYIDDDMATTTSGQSMAFPMSSTWTNTPGSGSGTYNLSPTGFNNPNAYTATTSEMANGANYSTNEVTGGSVVGASCDTENTYMLSGYSTGNTLSEAESATMSMTIPAFTNLMNDKFVIVWNETCDDENDGSNDDGNIGGDVVQDNGVLNVDSIEVVDSSATADNTYPNGWKYIFHITAPTNEPNLAMKFSDWLSGANIIPVANNMRVSSAQASNPGPITLTAANTYSTPPFIMTGDLNAGLSGRQVEVTVEVKIPVGTPSGSYTTTYGVTTTP
ncbi:MAG: hypothetical protein Q7S10_03560 [bacterium]|nr:hypothetical protein [bacterium]